MAFQPRHQSYGHDRRHLATAGHPVRWQPTPRLNAVSGKLKPTQTRRNTPKPKRKHMKSSSNQNQTSRAKLVPFALAVGSVLLLASLAPVHAEQTQKVIPRKAAPYGQSYGEWSAQWWRWGL